MRRQTRLKRWPEQFSEKGGGSETEGLGLKKSKGESKWRALCLVLK